MEQHLYLTGQIATVAVLRKQLTDAKAELQAARDAWDADHANELEAIKALSDQLATAETDLKAHALDHYAATQDKKPLDGIQIKVMRKVLFDANMAYEWAKAHPDKGLLTLDAKLYEKRIKIARENNLDDWADAPGEIVDTPQAQIASDLSSYLEPEIAS